MHSTTSLGSPQSDGSGNVYLGEVEGNSGRWGEKTRKQAGPPQSWKAGKEETDSGLS